MAQTPIFPCTVDDTGRVSMPAWAVTRYRRWRETLKGQRGELVLRRVKSKRSEAQNRWWWGVAIPLMAAEAGYDKHEYEDFHYWLVVRCFGTHERDGVAMPNKRSSQLSVSEFSELMEWAQRFAVEFYGVQLPLPGEVDTT